MTLSDYTPPVETPVSTADLAAHLRLSSGFADDGSENAILDVYLRAAATVIERRTSHTLIERHVLWRLAERPSKPIHAPTGPIFQIYSAALIDAAGDVTPLDVSKLSLQQGVHPPRIDLTRLPQTGEGGHLQIGLGAGYGATPDDIPADLRQAVLLLAAHYYENRTQSEDDAGPIPIGVASLIEPHRPIRL